MTSTLEDVSFLPDEDIKEAPPSEQETMASGPEEPGEKRRRSTASRLLELADDVELFHTPEDDSFAAVPMGARTESVPVAGRAFKRWLQQRFYALHRDAPSESALNEAVRTLDARARCGIL